jgi:N-acetylglucosamine kinase-like BadF-type ATPase
MDQLAKALGYSGTLQKQCERMCLALPGAATDTDQKLAEAALTRAGWGANNVSILDDTWAGLIAGLSSCRGICAFAGTGASVFVGHGSFDLDRIQKLDGWGAFLGDRGSGFQLVMKVFRQIARTFDLGQTIPLANALFVADKVEITSLVQLQEWFDQRVRDSPTDWNIEIGRLAELIVRRAEDDQNPDELARSLVCGVAQQMADTICIAVKRFDSNCLPIVLQGGMFEHSLVYRKTVEEKLRETIPNTIKMAKGRPLYGSLLMCAIDEMSAPSDEAIKDVEAKVEVPPDYARFLYY